MVRGVAAAFAALIVALLAVPASAATQRQVTQAIFSDLADNGRLDGNYTPAQINRALHIASLKDYQSPSSPRLPEAKPEPAKLQPVANDPGAWPFSGVDLALFGSVGAPLLLLGASLGRFARVKGDGG
jgi:hypothetical protein